ncbi:hypothetical protein K4K53_003298 [Colletotrichum sp. SAR 10_77]|nr:hypothetical protein K4K56_007972 [Colletotrichum sp. SAR 10_98]KAI8259466.1 hypothetical protein K4K53_003298 [Colletotrichum sp. SAR 10_77]
MASIAARSISEARLVDSVVVGGGPGGLAAIGNLLEHRPQHRQLWVDRLFQAGRVGTSYRQVPSNTKAGLFVDFAKAVAPFRQILEATEEPNAFTTLQQLQQDQGLAVVGSSHSAVLVLMNLYNLATTSHPNLRIKWFTRHNELRYAEYKDGWILYDNTGLKGQAAVWARNNLEERLFGKSSVKKFITKVLTPPEEEQAVYASELPGCTHLIQAIGFQRNPLPDLGVVEKAGAETQPLSVYHDASNGRFSAQPVEASAKGRTYIPGLFGAGIAFPERVVDRAGNVEDAVGFWKFMTFLKKSVPDWIESSK